MRKIMKNRKALVSRGRKQGDRAVYTRFLIVCEGTDTEPNYFRSFIKDRWSEVKTVGSVIKGCGRGTCQLVAEAVKMRDELESRRQVKFDRIWLVFDKDEFIDFTKAIRDAKKEGMKCAWSNESFELWYCLHFQNISTGVERTKYISMIESVVRKASGKRTYKYDKASTEILKYLNEYGNEEQACAWARQIRGRYAQRTDFDKHNPRTEVDLLIDELKHPERVL